MRTFRCTTEFEIPAGFQMHHVLPVAVFAGAAFGDAFARLRADGFDLRYFNTNGLPLPATEEAANDSGRPLHRGPHRRYNAMVFERVAAIVREMDSLQYSLSARMEAVQRLLILIAALRRCLSGDRNWISLNSRDPMHNQAAFQNLDSAIDILWSATK